MAAPLALPLAGIAGALIAVVLLYALAGRDASTLTLILAGVAINGFAAAATALALNLSPNPFAATEIVFWMMGSLADRSIDHLQLAAPLMILGWALLLMSGRALDALTLGEETAASLGVPLARLRFMLVLGTALAVGSGVAVTGAVGFVGLVAPHLMRPWVAHQPGRLLIASAACGSGAGTGCRYRDPADQRRAGAQAGRRDRIDRCPVFPSVGDATATRNDLMRIAAENITVVAGTATLLR